MVTKQTLDKYNKLYFLEFDHITHTSQTTLNEKPANSENLKLTIIPGGDSKCKTETESLNLMYRDYLLCNANNAALWWFDMFDGWFRSDGMMSAISRILAINSELLSAPHNSAAEIAVIAEGGESYYHVRKTPGLATYGLSNIRRALNSMGAPYDLYSVCDLNAAENREY